MNHNGSAFEPTQSKDVDAENISEVLDFSSFDLATTIRLIVQSAESRRIDVRKGRRQGSIFIRSGEIYHVVTRDKAGDEAFFDILSWKDADHRDVSQQETPEVNLRISTGVLLDLLQKRP
ncbi:MAG: DUF4388 domain-containing protein [Desulfomonile sp.]|nr:DUF4388 domain-containing protein [Desulfomonile sp.]